VIGGLAYRRSRVIALVAVCIAAASGVAALAFMTVIA
jgi:hypothetical protein